MQILGYIYANPWIYVCKSLDICMQILHLRIRQKPFTCVRRGPVGVTTPPAPAGSWPEAVESAAFEGSWLEAAESAALELRTPPCASSTAATAAPLRSMPGDKGVQGLVIGACACIGWVGVFAGFGWVGVCVCIGGSFCSCAALLHQGAVVTRSSATGRSIIQLL